MQHKDKKTVSIDTARAFSAAAAREDNLIGRRIAAARRENRLSQSALAERLGAYGVTLKNTAVAKWETGETVPSSYQLLALCHALKIADAVRYFTLSVPDASPPLNAKGLQLLEDYKSLLIDSGRYSPESAENIAVTTLDMPYSILRPSAGPGNFLDDENFEMRPFPASAVPSGADFALSVDGVSMEPVYTDGQLVWIKKCDYLRPGEVGLFMVGGQGYLKIYSEKTPDVSVREHYTDSDGYVHRQPVLLSYNPDYEPWEIPPNTEFRIAGRALN